VKPEIWWTKNDLVMFKKCSLILVFVVKIEVQELVKRRSTLTLLLLPELFAFETFERIQNF
jgi:hypothetical protein